MQWRTWPDGTQDVPIDSSHQGMAPNLYDFRYLSRWTDIPLGPCSVYMKKIDQNQQSLAGAGWFKIFHDGVSNGKFCTDRLRANGNKMTFRIPKDLAGYVHLTFETSPELLADYWYTGVSTRFVLSTSHFIRPVLSMVPNSMLGMLIIHPLMRLCYVGPSNPSKLRPDFFAFYRWQSRTEQWRDC